MAHTPSPLLSTFQHSWRSLTIPEIFTADPQNQQDQSDHGRGCLLWWFEKQSSTNPQRLYQPAGDIYCTLHFVISPSPSLTLFFISPPFSPSATSISYMLKHDSNEPGGQFLHHAAPDNFLAPQQQNCKIYICNFQIGEMNLTTCCGEPVGGPPSISATWSPF